MLTARIRSALATGLFVASVGLFLNVAWGAGKESPADRLLKDFRRAWSGAKGGTWVDEHQQQIGDAASATGADAARLVESLAAFAERTAGFSAAAAKNPFATKKAKKAKQPAEPRVYPLPREVMYQFGGRQLVAMDEASNTLRGRIEHQDPIKAENLSGEGRFEQMVNGCLPQTELIIIGIQITLDEYRGADDYAQFLEAWRNGGPYGDESFYEALDRTVGTDEETFFYDAMLADFVGKFAKEEGKRWNLGERHDNNQQCFLSYRQYRGLIEAVAYSLALAPDVPLPGRLARYDYPSVSGGAYSLRHQIDIQLAANHGDAAAVVEWVREFLAANPPPEKLWLNYAPTQRIGEQFLAEVPDFTTKVEQSTDELLAAGQTMRRALAEAIRNIALSAIPAK